jgi:hypothetical protein
MFHFAQNVLVLLHLKISKPLFPSSVFYLPFLKSPFPLIISLPSSIQSPSFNRLIKNRELYFLPSKAHFPSIVVSYHTFIVSMCSF